VDKDYNLSITVTTEYSGADLERRRKLDDWLALMAAPRPLVFHYAITGAVNNA
jgi:hypothetical protein